MGSYLWNEDHPECDAGAEKDDAGDEEEEGVGISGQGEADRTASRSQDEDIVDTDADQFAVIERWNCHL